MPHLPRRTALAATGAGLGTALAGCLGDGPTIIDRLTATEPDAVDVLQLDGRPAGPPWFADPSAFAGRSLVIDSNERYSDAGIIADTDSDRRDELYTFIEETDFWESVLVYVLSAGPNECYDRLEIADVSVSRIRVLGTARPIESDRADCPANPRFPSALVRVTVGEDAPSRAEFTIENGWGTTATTTATSELETVFDPDALPGTIRPAGDPPAVPANHDCPDPDFNPHPPGFDEAEFAWGDLTDPDGNPVLAMRVSQPTVELGETVRVALGNVSNRVITVGNRHRFNLQLRTADGWQDVRGVIGEPRLLYTDEGISFPPGWGYVWEFPMTESGVLEDHTHEDELVVCPDLVPGRYRFVYWSIDGIAAGFDVTD